MKSFEKDSSFNLLLTRSNLLFTKVVNFLRDHGFEETKQANRRKQIITIRKTKTILNLFRK